MKTTEKTALLPRPASSASTHQKRRSESCLFRWRWLIFRICLAGFLIWSLFSIYTIDADINDLLDSIGSSDAYDVDGDIEVDSDAMIMLSNSAPQIPDIPIVCDGKTPYIGNGTYFEFGPQNGQTVEDPISFDLRVLGNIQSDIIFMQRPDGRPIWSVQSIIFMSNATVSDTLDIKYGQSNENEPGDKDNKAVPAYYYHMTSPPDWENRDWTKCARATILVMMPPKQWQVKDFTVKFTVGAINLSLLPPQLYFDYFSVAAAKSSISQTSIYANRTVIALGDGSISANVSPFKSASIMTTNGDVDVMVQMKQMKYPPNWQQSNLRVDAHTVNGNVRVNAIHDGFSTFGVTTFTGNTEVNAANKDEIKYRTNFQRLKSGTRTGFDENAPKADIVLSSVKGDAQLNYP
ncbi:hypothetical protein GQ42DRAFT_165407 [Ramicandelaber brevisporus]|nr:hypothetical protein GQ42DRAFT_165407 [Ramicandelaber brevisporus]